MKNMPLPPQILERPGRIGWAGSSPTPWAGTGRGDRRGGPGWWDEELPSGGGSARCAD